MRRGGTEGGAATPPEASFSQERLWFVERLDPSSGVFNLLNGFVIRGKLDRRALGMSVREIVRRHEALRTNLAFRGGRLRQLVGEAPEEVFDFIDLSHEPGGGLVKAESMAVGWAEKPMDLAEDTLFRAVLFKTGEEEHLLAILCHHAVFDGWSLRVFANELVSIYTALAEGRGHQLPEPAVQYSEYSDWQRGRFERGELDSELEYWARRMGQEPPALELPADRPRGARQSYKGEVFTVFLPGESRERLKELGKRNGCTLYMTLLAAFYAFLSRYTGNGDIVVGCPVAGRGKTELEGALGLFVNTVPLRADLSDDPPFAELLRRAREVALQGYTHQELPFEKIVEKLKPERDLSHPPVYQTMLQLRNFPERLPSPPGMVLERHSFGWARAQVDLFMDVSEEAGGLRCDLVYPPALFDRATMERMAGHWVRILGAVVANPGLRVSRIPMMSGGEIERLVFELNETSTDYPRDLCVHQLFERVAGAHPGAVAITHGASSVSYAGLNERANRLANYLLSGGMAKGEAVGICLERSVNMIVACLAVLKAGGTYVPLSPNDPPQRLDLIVEEIRGRRIITASGHQGRLPRDARLICLDREGEAVAREGGDGPPNRADPTDMAYVIFTSGSTGAPKGVCCHHRGIVRLVVNTNYVKFSPGDTVVNSSNPTFDPTTFEVWGALLNGARLLIIDREVLLSGRGFKELIRKECADVAFMTTALFHHKAKQDPGSFASLRELFVGGEAMDPSAAGAVLSSDPPKRLINFYGPTENTGFSTFHEVGRVSEGATSVPIGRNISNSKSYILDKNMQPVPQGVRGEIYVAGDGLALGYFNKPELTAASFLPNPFHGGAMYRTGDMGRYRADGTLEYMGRADLQVKIRGFRVEPAEVESVVARHPAVAMAAVVAREGYGRERRLHAYVSLAEGASAGSAELGAYARERLPDYMVPSSFTVLGSLPLTATGKIDRASLPVPEGEGAGEGPTGRPKGELEERLAGLWQRVLGGRAVGREDNFFDLGGHSLLAIRLFSLMEQELGVSLPVADIFRFPTLGALAEEARRHMPGGYRHVIPLREGGSRPPLFLVHPGGGEVLNYRRLVEALGEDQPVYGLRAAGLGGDEPLPKTIEEAAASYLAEVLQVQRGGPYHIAGWCIGAAIAYEMAQQLRGAGQEVGLLGVLNFEAPLRERWGSRRVTRGALLREAAFLVADLLRFGRGVRRLESLEIPRRVVRLERLSMRAIGILPPDEVILPGENMPLPGPWKRAILNLGRALRSYEPRPYGGVLTVFRQEHIPLISPTDPYYGWRRLASGGMVVFNSKGKMHGGLIEPPEVSVTAVRIRERMDWHEARAGVA